MHQIFYEHGPGAWGDSVDTLRFKINGGGTFIFFVIFGDSPLQLILTVPFVNFSNFTREYKEVHKYITDSCCFVTISGSAIY